MSLDNLLARLNEDFRLNTGLLPEWPVVFQFDFAAEAPFHLEAKPGGYRFSPGVHRSPTLRLHVDTHETLVALLTRELDGMEAFMAGRYRADGNIVLSQVLLYLFSAAKA